MADPATCSLCGLPGATLDAGGDVGLCHRACFVRADRAAEAFERMEVEMRSSWPITFQAQPRPRRPYRLARAVEVQAS